jgi:hypothetical protein
LAARATLRCGAGNNRRRKAPAEFLVCGQRVDVVSDSIRGVGDCMLHRTSSVSDCSLGTSVTSEHHPTSWRPELQ